MAAVELNCPICRDVFEKPVIITCGHSFCFKCLEGHIKDKEDSFNCPCCRREIEIPTTGMSGFIINYALIRGSTREETLCAIDRKVACYICLICAQNLCDGCSYVHGKLNMTKSHELLDLGFLDPSAKGTVRHKKFCVLHDDNEIKYFCVDCNTLICVDCKLLKHSNHRIQSIADAAAAMKNNLETRINEQPNQMNHIRDAIQKLEKHCKTITDKEYVEICVLEAQQHLLQAKLDQNVKKNKEVIQNVYQGLLQQTKTCINDLKGDLNVMSESNNIMQSLVQKGTVFDLLEKGPGLESKIAAASMSKSHLTFLEKDLFSPADICDGDLNALIGMVGLSTEMSLEEREQEEQKEKEKKEQEERERKEREDREKEEREDRERQQIFDEALNRCMCTECGGYLPGFERDRCYSCRCGKE